MALFWGLLSGCASKKVTLNIVVFNYTESNLTDLIIGESYVQGYYWSKTGGGGVVSGVSVPIGNTTVSWVYDTFAGDERPTSYFARKVDAAVPKPNKGERFLGVHIYPGDVVEFSLSNDIPGKKKLGKSYDKFWYKNKDSFYDSWDKWD